MSFISGETNDAVLDGFTITNGAAEDGGGIVTSYSSPKIINCVIDGNTAGWGAGIYFSGESTPIIENCQFTNNYAIDWSENHSHDSSGGAIGSGSSSLTIINSTFSRNSASNGSVIEIHGVDGNSASAFFKNCIFYENYGDAFAHEYSTCSNNCSGIDVTYSLSSYEGENNILGEPDFVSPDGGDFTLQSISEVSYNVMLMDGEMAPGARIFQREIRMSQVVTVNKKG